MEGFETPECDVLICDGNKQPLGTGVLLVPKDSRYVFILTVAHLFRNKDKPSAKEVNLNIYSYFLRNMQRKEERDRGRICNVECLIFTTRDAELNDEDCFILLHSDYVPGDERSPHDYAVIRLGSAEWMKEMKLFFLLQEYKEGITLCGHGYPKGTDIERVSRGGDFCNARSRFVGTSDTRNSDTQEIKVTHDYPDTVNLKGYSGTGIFDKQGTLYGVVSRMSGNDVAPGACIISGWKGFEVILETFGWKPSTDTVEESILDINLKVQGHWLLNCNGESRGLMEDQKVVNLASLLLGMTDAYAVILATTWKNGIGHALEKILNEFADSNHLKRESLPFQKWKEVQSLNYSAQTEEGVVVNIAASRQDILSYIKELLVKYEAVPLIVNIWSERPAEALEVTTFISENPQLRSRADFVSLIDYYAKLDVGTPRTTDAARNLLMQLNCKSLEEKEACIFRYKDQDTQLWWDLIPEFAGEENAEENFIGYKIAQSSETAVQRWLGAHAGEDLEKLFRDDILYSLFSQDEVDALAVHLWRYIRESPDYGHYVWEDCFQHMRDCCSEHTALLFDVLGGESEISDGIDLFFPEDICIWADLVKNADFERDIGEVQRNEAFYWIAIMRNINGVDYVIKERLKQQKQRFVSKLLNRVSEIESDEFIESRTNYIRKYIRTT